MASPDIYAISIVFFYFTFIIFRKPKSKTNRKLGSNPIPPTKILTIHGRGPLRKSVPPTKEDASLR